MNPLVIITARGGSKGIPGKNTKLLGSKPLIHYTIEEALKLFPANRILVSTDSKEIKESAELCEISVPFLRPSYLAQDESSSYDVIVHAMKFMMDKGLEFDTVILLQPTSPFRKAHHISKALELYSDDIDMVVSVKISDENPYYSLFEETENGYLTKSKQGDFTRRQDCPKVYSYNGAIYIMNATSLLHSTISEFKKIKKFVMSSKDSIDIDTDLDWTMAEIILNQ